MSTLNWPPLFRDVVTDYSRCRRTGASRAQATSLLYERFSDELKDAEDGSIVILALAYSLGRKHELTQILLEKATDAIEMLHKNQSEASIIIPQVEKTIFAQNALGPEARYPQKRLYDPGWVNGDTFAHQLKTPHARELGLSDNVVLLRRVGSYFDVEGDLAQIVYVTLCSPNKIPKNSEELNALGLLPMMGGNGRYEYCGQINFTSRRKEQSFELRKIGHFPTIPIPSDASDDNPYTARPLLGMIVKGTSYPSTLKVQDYPSFEDDICLCYRLFGVKKNY